jgi:hypothetical protein
LNLLPIDDFRQQQLRLTKINAGTRRERNTFARSLAVSIEIQTSGRRG